MYGGLEPGAGFTSREVGSGGRAVATRRLVIVAKLRAVIGDGRVERVQTHSRSCYGIRVQQQRGGTRTTLPNIGHGQTRGSREDTRSGQVPAVSSAVCAVAAATSGCRSRPHVRRTYAVCSDLSLEPSPSRCQRVARYLFVNMDCLRMLTQVIEAGESAGAVAFEGAFTCVFSVEYQYKTPCRT